MKAKPKYDPELNSNGSGASSGLQIVGYHYFDQYQPSLEDCLFIDKSWKTLNFQSRCYLIIKDERYDLIVKVERRAYIANCICSRLGELWLGLLNVLALCAISSASPSSTPSPPSPPSPSSHPPPSSSFSPLASSKDVRLAPVCRRGGQMKELPVSQIVRLPPLGRRRKFYKSFFWQIVKPSMHRLNVSPTRVIR